MSELFKKLNLKDQANIWVLNAPQSFGSELSCLSGVHVHRSLEGTGQLGFSLAFVTRQAEVDELAHAIASRAVGDVTVWFAYPKASSRRYTCEFNRDTGWAVLGELGFEGVRQVAIDADWSALRFRRVEYIKTLSRAQHRRLSEQGQRR